MIDNIESKLDFWIDTKERLVELHRIAQQLNFDRSSATTLDYIHTFKMAARKIRARFPLTDPIRQFENLEQQIDGKIDQLENRLEVLGNRAAAGLDI